jgi:hypothetical protein
MGYLHSLNEKVGDTSIGHAEFPKSGYITLGKGERVGEQQNDTKGLQQSHMPGDLFKATDNWSNRLLCAITSNG